MLSGSGARFGLGFWISMLAAGCNERGTAEQQSRPLPIPEPPASPSASVARADVTVVPKKRPASEEPKEASKPKTADGTSGKPPSAAPPVASASGGAAAGGSNAAPTPPGPTASVPALSAPSAACLSRCQGAMQGCLSAPVDGGVPGFANLELCKKAFEACQNACAKP